MEYKVESFSLHEPVRTETILELLSSDFDPNRQMGLFYAGNLEKPSYAMLSHAHANLASTDVNKQSLALRVFRNGGFQISSAKFVRLIQSEDSSILFQLLYFSPELSDADVLMVLKRIVEIREKWPNLAADFLQLLADKRLPEALIGFINEDMKTPSPATRRAAYRISFGVGLKELAPVYLALMPQSIPIDVKFLDPSAAWVKSIRETQSTVLQGERDRVIESLRRGFSHEEHTAGGTFLIIKKICSWFDADEGNWIRLSGEDREYIRRSEQHPLERADSGGMNGILGELFVILRFCEGPSNCWYLPSRPFLYSRNRVRESLNPNDERRGLLFEGGSDELKVSFVRKFDSYGNPRRHNGEICVSCMSAVTTEVWFGNRHSTGDDNSSEAFYCPDKFIRSYPESWWGNISKRYFVGMVPTSNNMPHWFKSRQYIERPSN